MGWTWDGRPRNEGGSGRDINAWLNPIDRRAVVLIDPYNLADSDTDPAFRAPKQLFDPIRADILSRGFAGWAVAETGCATGLLSAGKSDQWMRDLGAYAQDSDALGICYFDGTGSLAAATLTPSMAAILGAAARA